MVLRVCVVAHCPTVGVKIYDPLVVLFIVAGFHVPIIPLGDVLPKTGATEPKQNAGIGGKLGTVAAVIVTFSVCDIAHCPVFGVNIYESLVVLLIVDGLHVPAIPFGDVFPKIGATDPEQNAGIAAKLGTY